MAKKIPVRKILYFFPAAAGILGLLLRIWFFNAGMDDKHLLIPEHPANVLSFIVAAVSIAVIAVCAFTLPKERIKKPFPKSIAGTVGCGVAAAGIILGELSFGMENWFGIACIVLRILSAGCFVLLALSRSKGEKTSLLFCIATCVYFCTELLGQYHLWSAEPQFQRYCFPLCASVFLMLCCYHRCVLDIKGIGLRQYTFLNRAAQVFCLLSVNGKNGLFYFAMACWTAAELYLPEAQIDEAAQ